MRLSVRMFARPQVEAKPLLQRSLRVAIIGPPNVGKSALTNQLVKMDLCAVSRLIDTTRKVTKYLE